MDIIVVKANTKPIGSLALTYPYLKRLGFAHLIDEVTTTAKEREVATGRVIHVLVLNRLWLKPTPMSKMDAWVQSQVIADIDGSPTDSFNDDRIGRALDEIYPHLAAAWVTVVLRGGQVDDVDLRHLHRDVTRVSFAGADDPAPGETPTVAITHGYSGREDPTRKQVTLWLSVAADGAPDVLSSRRRQCCRQSGLFGPPRGRLPASEARSAARRR